MTDFTMDMQARMGELLTRFKLPAFATEAARRFTDAGHAAALPTLLEVLEAEADERGQRKTERLLRASRLPPGKTLETLDRARLPRGVMAKLDELASGDFLERAHNVLCFGLPGRGKTHAAAALGHALVQRGHSVLLTPTFRLVQELLSAKRDLALPRALQRLDAFDLLILDDIGYVQQSADEVEVLFTLMAERYERRSLVIQPGIWGVGPDLQEPDDHRRCDRPLGPPLGHPRILREQQARRRGRAALQVFPDPAELLTTTRRATNDNDRRERQLPE